MGMDRGKFPGVGIALTSSLEPQGPHQQDLFRQGEDESLDNFFARVKLVAEMRIQQLEEVQRQRAYRARQVARDEARFSEL